MRLIMQSEILKLTKSRRKSGIKLNFKKEMCFSGQRFQKLQRFGKNPDRPLLSEGHTGYYFKGVEGKEVVRVVFFESTGFEDLTN